MESIFIITNPKPRRAGQAIHIGRVEVFEDSENVIRMTCGANIDADGAPTAYSLTKPALDVVADAGYPNGDWRDVLVASPYNLSKPVVDGDGYFVSMTTYRIPGFSVSSHSSWLDASTIPYAVINPIVRERCAGICIGCMVYVTYNGLTVPMVCGDVSGEDSIGEISVAGAKLLGIPSSAIDGGVSGKVSYAFHTGVPAILNNIQYVLQAA